MRRKRYHIYAEIGVKIVTFSLRISNIYKLRKILWGYIFLTLLYLPTELSNVTYIKMLFRAVVIDFFSLPLSNISLTCKLSIRAVENNVLFEFKWPCTKLNVKNAKY